MHNNEAHIQDNNKQNDVASLMIAYRLHGRNVLIVGGGKVATERTQAALEAGAKVVLIAPNLTTTLRALVETKRIEWIDRTYSGGEEDQKILLKADMVLSTTDDEVISAEIANLCRSNKIPVNCADIPHLCDFWFMSVHRDGPLQIGVSTNGHGPRLSSLLRKQIAASLPPAVGTAVERVGVLRKKIRLTDPDPSSVRRRMKWLSELCDHTPLDVLSRMSGEDMESLLLQYKEQEHP